MAVRQESHALPGAHLDWEKMPGHWLLARLGKRVLRPGGLELTRAMLDGLDISPRDTVVELAPGLGTTARLALARAPASYVGVERDEAAVASTRRYLRPGRDDCRRGVAANTELPDAFASVLYGEAMLSMQTTPQKEAIVREARRVLRSGGRYGIHELAIAPDDLAVAEKEAIQRELSDAIHVGARPLTVGEWRELLEGAGFRILQTTTAPMHLLHPTRILADEGLAGALRFAANVARTPAAWRRLGEMRSMFRKHEARLCAVMFVAEAVS